jgi:pRiA4b ORF-3-like protein
VGATKSRELYQFKVTLRGIFPPIWRRIQVWENYTLAQLHRVLQVVMGWENYHLYEFRIGGKLYGDPELDDERESIDVKRTRISNVLSEVGTEFEYVYDFGDHWQHDLVLEPILQPVPDTAYPRCIAGGRSCPPEDVGGSGGYEDYLSAIADPKQEEHHEMMAWRGPFDPEAFSVEKVNRELEKKFRPVRRRAVQQPAGAYHGSSAKADLLRAILSKPIFTRKERIRIEANETVPLELTERECELILSHTFADEPLTNRLRVVPKKGEQPVLRFTLDDLDELAGFLAAEANPDISPAGSN